MMIDDMSSPVGLVACNGIWALGSCLKSLKDPLPPDRVDAILTVFDLLLEHQPDARKMQHYFGSTLAKLALRHLDRMHDLSMPLIKTLFYQVSWVQEDADPELVLTGMLALLERELPALEQQELSVLAGEVLTSWNEELMRDLSKPLKAKFGERLKAIGKLLRAAWIKPHQGGPMANAPFVTFGGNNNQPGVFVFKFN